MSENTAKYRREIALTVNWRNPAFCLPFMGCAVGSLAECETCAATCNVATDSILWRRIATVTRQCYNRMLQVVSRNARKYRRMSDVVRQHSDSHHPEGVLPMPNTGCTGVVRVGYPKIYNVASRTRHHLFTPEGM